MYCDRYVNYRAGRDVIYVTIVLCICPNSRYVRGVGGIEEVYDTHQRAKLRLFFYHCLAISFSGGKGNITHLLLIGRQKNGSMVRSFSFARTSKEKPQIVCDGSQYCAINVSMALIVRNLPLPLKHRLS